MLSAKQAAELVGMTKAGIIKAIRTGKLSATKNQKGEWEIDPAELLRVYTPVSQSEAVDVATNADSQVDAGPHPSTLQREVDLLREMLADKDDTIRDLRQRLDREADERQKLTRLLTDNQHTPNRQRWWQRLLPNAR